MNTTPNKKKSIIFVIFIASLLIVVYSYGIVSGKISGEGIFYDSYLAKFGPEAYVNLKGWKSYSLDPLRSQIKEELCLKFELNMDNVLCDQTSEVYEPDFFPIIKDTFMPGGSDWATFDEVQAILGQYNYEDCEYWTPPPGPMPEKVLRCRYSLSGYEQITVFSITFDTSNDRVISISSVNKRDFK